MKTVYLNQVEILNKKRLINAYKLLELHKYPVIRDISNKDRYAVKSESETYYEVLFLNTGNFCSCIDFQNYGHLENFECKHIQAIRIMKARKRRFPKGILNFL